MKIRTTRVVAMTAVLPALGIAACGGASGPAAGQDPGSISAATVKACDDILAFENSDAEGTFNQEPASVKALHDAGHTPLFFALYFGMTGLHATHMVVGVGIILFLISQARKGAYGAAWHTPVELFGLYWHFVDIVWIFLFPLLYLINRHPV